jgi:hypothetical protein
MEASLAPALLPAAQANPGVGRIVADFRTFL